VVWNERFPTYSFVDIPIYFLPFWDEKEAAKRFGFGVTVVVEGPGSDALSRTERLLKFDKQPAPELSKRPALIHLSAGRITVDAREKG